VAAGQEREALQGILRSGGVPPDAVLVVHSAIAGLSRQGFRAEAMIDALLEHLREGTLLMPTMTWRTVTPQNPVFDELATPSHTGVLTEVFRTKYASARSLHPTHSAAGAGPLARTLLSTHHLGTTPVPASSPYALMRDYRSHILMIGVGLECVTAIHHPEEAVAPDIYLKPDTQAEDYELRARDGRRIKYRLRRHVRTRERDFPKFAPLLARKRQFHAGELLGVPWRLVRADDLLREVFARLIERPDFNLQKGG
jgi:aminoglycoside 3-N-acetyltransferase